MDDMYSLTIDWTTPVMVAFLAIVGLGFWSYLCWESLRNERHRSVRRRERRTTRDVSWCTAN